MQELAPIEITSDSFFHSHNKLPALPQILTQINELMNDDEISIAEISTLVSSDVALSAQILKIVNSAYYGLRKEVSNLKIAIAFLGMTEIYKIVLSLSVINSIDIEDKKGLKDFWYHSYYTALCARFLASKYHKLLDQDELWSSALLHDIGSLVYIKFYPEHYNAVLALSEEKGILRSHAEQALSVPLSSVFGSLLCTYWRLPHSIKAICESHSADHIDTISEDDQLADFKKIIAIANMCSELSLRELSQDTVQLIAGKIMHHLNIEEQEFILLMGEVRNIRLDVDRFVNSLF